MVSFLALLDSKPEKSNQNARMISLLDSKPEKSNQNAKMISLLDSKPENSNQNTEMIFPPSSKKRRKTQSFKRAFCSLFYCTLPPYYDTRLNCIKRKISNKRRVAMLLAHLYIIKRSCPKHS